MAKAFQCDRCGQCFAPGNAEFVQIGNFAFVRGDKYTSRFDGMEFCLECSHEFKEWFMQKEHAAKNHG